MLFMDFKLKADFDVGIRDFILYLYETTFQVVLIFR